MKAKLSALGLSVRFYVILAAAALLLLTGCTTTKIPMPNGKSAWSVRFLNWTKMGSMNFDGTNGATNISITITGYEGRVDAEGVKATGGAVGEGLGAVAKKVIVP